MDDQLDRWQVVHTYSERMAYRPWRRVFVYDRGQCGSTNDIMALTSNQAVKTFDIARGRYTSISSSSSAYPFTEPLIKRRCNESEKKLTID